MDLLTQWHKVHADSCCRKWIVAPGPVFHESVSPDPSPKKRRILPESTPDPWPPLMSTPGVGWFLTILFARRWSVVQEALPFAWQTYIHRQLFGALRKSSCRQRLWCWEVSGTFANTSDFGNYQERECGFRYADVSSYFLTETSPVMSRVLFFSSAILEDLLTLVSDKCCDVHRLFSFR